MGLLLDRLPRLLGVSLAFGLAAVGYLLIGIVEDPLGGLMLGAVIIAGIGEAGAVVSAGVLIGQEAPQGARGAVLGTFALSGAIGMVGLTFAGGQLYDRVGPGAPFVLMAIVNALVMLASLGVHRRATAAVTAAARMPSGSRQS
jgi:MFS family permease